ncbi:MAG: type I-E CRISPR-associated protein Cse2/CasB [Desulfobacterales bacterium PC51MH44]|nr:MAG: type I-E CRISPR-associated protein Cse2/CasB [Desulfobacterales bacterium PC51MH44]
MRSEYRFLTLAETNTLQKWHRWLDNNRGDRARLRRAERPEDVLLTDAFFYFLQQMPEGWQEKNPILTSATVAGLLSHVKKDRQTLSRGYQPKDKNKQRNMASFAEQLATPVKSKKPAMSELRFQQLQKSRTTDDFYRRILRAIRLLDGKVNILSLANDIIHWHREFDNQIDRKPSNRLAVCWATDYFIALQKK